MNESTAYEWAAQCLKPAESIPEEYGHLLQQVADKIAAALKEAALEGYRDGLWADEGYAEPPPIKYEGWLKEWLSRPPKFSAGGK